MEENQAATSKKPMNKTEIISALSEATGLTKQIAWNDATTRPGSR